MDELSFSQPPRSVVSLSPALTETLFDLNAAEALVAVSSDSRYPADKVAAMLKVGEACHPDIALVSRIRPELVLADDQNNRLEDVQFLREGGLTVWWFAPRSVREALDGLWAIVRLFRASSGQRLAMLETVYEWTSLASEQMTPVSLFCPGGRSHEMDGWLTTASNAYTWNLLRRCGGQDIFADCPGPQMVTTAMVIEREPEVILLPAGPGYPFTEAERDFWIAGEQTPAARQGRVHLVDGSLLTWPGTRLARALSELPALIQNA